LIGQTFEIYESTNNSAICSARTLNVVDSGYTSIVVVDGKIESIDTQHESVPFTPMSGGKYSHATLVANQDGTVCFEYLPYSPSPYPTDDTFTDVYVERNSNKIWAIAVLPDGSVGTFFQNDQTNGLLVFQIVSQQKSIELRIQEKTDKGYQKSLNKRFNAQSRTLTNII
jgi:hypothetical protein